MQSEYKHLVIIGGGATGAILLLRALEASHQKLRITILEPKFPLGWGKAYSTQSPEHLLNVPAGRMSVSDLNPEDFSDWVRRHHPEAENSRDWPFVPRSWFGQYLSEKVSSLSPDSFTHLRVRANRLERSGGGWRILLDQGQTLKADFVIVATGYQEDLGLNLSSWARLKGSERILQPFEHAKIQSIPKDDAVLVVGTALTGIDVAKELMSKGQRSFTLLSRRGILPLPHSRGDQERLIRVPRFAGMSPLQVFRCLRSLHFSKVSWDSLADQVRPQVQEIWAIWTDKERRQFGRHLEVYWNAIRHRVPSRVLDSLTEAMNRKEIQLMRGRIIEVEESGSGLNVRYLERGSGRESVLEVKWLVLAVGSAVEAKFYPCPERNLWFAGPSAKVNLYEITAIREIKAQAVQILSELGFEIRREGSSMLANSMEFHPESVGETYVQHLGYCLKVGFALIGVTLRLWIHGFAPWMYPADASDRLRGISNYLSSRRIRKRILNNDKMTGQMTGGSFGK